MGDEQNGQDGDVNSQNNARAIGDEPFDSIAFCRDLIKANSWADDIDIDEDNIDFINSRRIACIDRFRQGVVTWNVWAETMLYLRRRLEGNEAWQIVDKVGYWAKRLGEPEPPQAENEVTRLWLALSYSDFRAHNFENSPIFVRLQFPSVADFGPLNISTDYSINCTTFPDGVNFAGALFHGHAIFEQTHFLGGGANFELAEFSQEAFFRSAVFEGETEFVATKFGGMSTFDAADFRGFVNLSRSVFTDSVSFDKTTFADSAIFDKVKFNDFVSFDNTVAHDLTVFNGAVFEGMCYFYSAEFKAGASFIGAIFRGDTFFSPPAEESERSASPQFPGMMTFSRAVFEQFVTFEGATFYRGADFSAAQIKSSFSLANTTFQQIPDFSQADFKQAPQLDNARFDTTHEEEEEASAMSAAAFGKLVFSTPSELPGRFRALKRLAIQNHDYGRELEFFAKEIKARRGTLDRVFGPNAGAYWFGQLYQITSDFGRSLVRPLVWWCALLAIFPVFYWMIGSSDRPCSPVRSAMYISFRKSLPLVNVETGDKLKAAYACLYGNFGESNNVLIPYSVEVLTTIQIMFSAVLLFLFVLALRNNFRIR